MKLEVNDYESIKHKESFDIEPKHMSVSYDGGRLDIFINGKEIFSNYSCGNSFQIEFDEF